MRHIKKIITLVMVSLFTLIHSQIIFAESTQTEIYLNKSELKKDQPINKDTVYTPKKPTPVNLLPQTGEIMTSFIYIIIGLSILVFVIGLLINKAYLNSIDVRWDY